MTSAQYRAALDRLDLSHARAAEFLGFRPRMSFHYANGRYPVPVAVGKLLHLMLRLKLSPDEV